MLALVPGLASTGALDHTWLALVPGLASNGAWTR